MPQNNDKLTAIRIKQANGSYSPEIPIGAKAENVKYDTHYSVKEVLGNVKTNVAPLQQQIDNINTEALEDWIKTNIDFSLPPAGYDNNIPYSKGDIVSYNDHFYRSIDDDNENHTPSGSSLYWEQINTLTIDNSLTVSGAAADAEMTGKLITVNGETSVDNVTKLHFNTVNDTVEVLTTDDIDDTLSIQEKVADAAAVGAVKAAVEAHVTALPAGYTQIEYIESDRTQTTSIGIKGDQSTRFICRFKVLEEIATLDHAVSIFGGREETTKNAFAFGVSQEGRFRVNWNTAWYDVGVADNDMHTIEIDGNAFYIDGALRATAPEGVFTSKQNIQLFGIRGGNTYYYGAVRIYRAVMYDGDGLLVRDCVPALNTSNGRAYVYDFVTASAFGAYNPSKSVAFIVGPVTNIVGAYDRIETLEESVDGMQEVLNTAVGDISDMQGDIERLQEDVGGLDTDMTAAKGDIAGLQTVMEAHVTVLPAGYTQVEYLESDGTQTVTLGRPASPLTRLVCRFRLTENVNDDIAVQSYVFGARKSAYVSAFQLNYNSNGIFFGYGSHYPVEYVKVGKFDNLIHEIDVDKGAITFDGASFGTTEAGIWDSDGLNNLQAFGMRAGDTFYHGSAAIYGIQVYEDGVQVGDYVPCVRDTDGRTGLYNLIDGSFGVKYPTSADVPELAKGEITGLNGLYARVGAVEQEQAVKGSAPRGYVLAEAASVADRVRKVQTGRTLTFAAISDLHYKANGDCADIQAGLRDMRDAVRAIGDEVHLDFCACFGDLIYRLARTQKSQAEEPEENLGNFEIGKAEMIAVTRLISEAFGTRPQLRIVGNHDPNCEDDTGYFSAHELNSFFGIYCDMFTERRETTLSGLTDVSYQNGGYVDFERQHIRLIVLNTSLYGEGESGQPGQNHTKYRFGWGQAEWLARMIDLTDVKGHYDAEQQWVSEADQWNIVIFSHVGPSTLDYADDIGRFVTPVLAAYEAGTEWTGSSYSHDFDGRNGATLRLYVNGHSHRYYARTVAEVEYSSSKGRFVQSLNMANLFLPNALPGREEESPWGKYVKYPGTSSSTAFEIITIDPETWTVYAHHYGAGIDVILHCIPSAETTYTTELQSPIWGVSNVKKVEGESAVEEIATVDNGTVSAKKSGYVIIWAKSAADNCVECWNYHSVV